MTPIHITLIVLASLFLVGTIPFAIRENKMVTERMKYPWEPQTRWIVWYNLFFFWFDGGLSIFWATQDNLFGSMLMLAIGVFMMFSAERNLRSWAKFDKTSAFIEKAEDSLRKRGYY